MIFDSQISNNEQVKSEAIGKFEKYKTPPKKYNLEEEINKNYLEIKSFEKIKLEKSNCTKENCSCYEIKTAFESYSFKNIPFFSPNSLENQMENKFHNNMNVINIINNINQRTNKNNIENSEETNKNKDNVVKNLINDLNHDDILNTPVLGLKRKLSSSLFKHDYNEIQIVNNVVNNEINYKERNNYYVKEIKSKNYNQSRIKYNKNYYLMKSFENQNDKVYCKNTKMRIIEFKKRDRKTGDQIKQLKEIFKNCADWDKKKIDEVSSKIGLSVNQVYKWIWDQKRKCNNV